MLANDTLANVLTIDLTRKDYSVQSRPDLFNQYLGGTGVATQLLLENCGTGCDPLSPDNVIVFAVGPLTGMFPLASKTIAMFKSPHTGNLGESHCGGRSAIAIRMAGYGAIVIKGRSEVPVYLVINKHGVAFKNATTLWGMANSFTTGRILRDAEKDSGTRSIIRIGRAGEKMVSYACATAESFRHFGRLGLGAVFGSKHLKAIVVSGKQSIAPADVKLYRDIYDEIYKAAVDSPVMKKYHELGTPENILALNKKGGFPTRNLQSGQFEGVNTISGEYFAEHFLGRRIACSHCPVACIHLAELREPYEDEPYFYKMSVVGYDYEPIFSTGSMLGGSDTKGVLKLLDKIEVVGMDSMSTGVILAWATEAFMKGLLTTDDTLGVKPEWNNYVEYVKMIDLIVDQPNEFYTALAHGVDAAAKRYGGADYALAFGGNEMPGYHTGPGAHLGYMIGARHSHLDNAGYSVDQKELANKLSPAELAEKIVTEEQWRQILTSLTICLFARNLYKDDVILKALAAMGFTLTKDDLTKMGARIYKEKFNFKFREGYKTENYRFPKRIFETLTPQGKIDETYLNASLKCAQDLISAIPG